jgi:hypothetical protein
MTLTLPAPDAVDAPDWTIRPEQAIDLDLIHDLHREAFHRRHEAELVDAIRSGPDFLAELSLVAVTRDGSVLGHVLISRSRPASWRSASSMSRTRVGNVVCGRQPRTVRALVGSPHS